MASSRRRRRPAAATAALLAASVAPVVGLALPPGHSFAATKTFSSVGTDWLAAGNWSPSGVPTAADDIRITAGTSQMTLSSGSVDAQFITFSNFFSRALANQTTGATSTSLTLHGDGGGTSPLISVADAGSFTIHGPNAGTGSGALGLVLNASGQFSVTGPGELAITSIISETGGARSLEKTGAGLLTLGGANTFSGGFAVREGSVSIDAIADAGVAQPLGTNSTVTLGSSSASGTLIYTGANASTNLTFATAAGGAEITTINELTLAGEITGPGALTKSGAGDLVLSGALGRIGGSGGVTIAGGRLVLNNVVANNNDRIADANAVNLAGGRLEWNVALSAPTTETIGALNVVAGANTINTTVNFGLAGDGLLTAASLSRSAGSTISFLITDGGFVGFSSAPALSNGILGGWATYNRSGWATIDANTGRVVAYTDYTTASDTTTWTATQNISADGNRSITQDTTIHSLRFEPFAAPAAISIGAGSTLRVDNGILAPDSGHSIVGPGNLTAGATAGSELIITVPYDGEVLTVSAPIVDNAGGAVRVTKSGDGILELDGANNYTGSTDVLAGTLRLGANANVANTAIDVRAGATFDLNNQTKSVAGLNGAGDVTLGSGSLTFGSNALDTIIAGVISGSGSITKTGAGTTTLAGANTFAGATNIGDPNGVDAGGVLVVSSDAAFGAIPAAATPNSINLHNATLRLTGATTVTTLATSVPIGTRGVLLNANRGIALGPGGGKIDIPAGDYAEITGIIADAPGGTSPLHKIGDGTLDLRTGNHTYTGGVIIDGGTLGVNKDASFGAVPATLDADAVQLNNGATIAWYSNVGTAGLHANRGLTVGPGGGTIEWNHSSGVPNISHPITSAAGNTLTKKGDDTVLSNIAQPDMNGDLNVNQGRWNLQTNGAAGNGTIHLTAADTGVAATSIAQLGIGGSNLNLTVTTAQDIVLAPTTGTNSFEVNTTNTLILNGTISGTGGVTKGRVNNTAGTLTLGGNNTYTGENTVRFGTLQVASNANLGDAVNGITLGGAGAAATLKIAGNVLGAARTVTLASGGGIIDTNGFDATFGNLAGTANFTKNAAGQLTVNHVRANNLTVNDGTLAIAPSSQASGASNVATLTIAPVGRLDLNDNKLITTSPSGTATAGVYDGVQGLVQSGYAGGAWNGNGIMSSSAAAIPAGEASTAIGVATGAQVNPSLSTPGNTALFAGQTITGASTIAMYTYGGDANLDGFVSGDDYTAIDFAIAVPGASGWVNGDFNYDGIISGDDYTVIDFNIAAQGAPFSTSGAAAGAVAAVPEPCGLGVLGLAGAAALATHGRRRRRRGRA